MKYQVKSLAFPGSILHPTRGRIDLHKLNQKKLRELYDEGSTYVALIPGDPPNEQPIVVKSTPKNTRKKPPREYTDPDKDSKDAGKDPVSQKPPE